MSKPLNIIISGGGTGGHLFPALAIGDELQMQNSKHTHPSWPQLEFRSRLLTEPQKDRMEGVYSLEGRPSIQSQSENVSAKENYQRIFRKPCRDARVATRSQHRALFINTTLSNSCRMEM